MNVTDSITACGVVVAAGTILVTVILYMRDQRQQRAAQTREVLQAIIGDCGRFLHPLSQDAPYPILHTTAVIIKEFRSNLCESNPCESYKAEDVLAKLHNCDLLLSICVEGWVSSTEILRMMNIVEALERKASSHNLRGKLLLICQASYLLAGIVSKVCSPTTFYDIMSQLEDPKCCKDTNAQVILDELAIELQKTVCQEFNIRYRDTMKQCLFFIQIAAVAILHLPDAKLVRLSKVNEAYSHTPTDNEMNKLNRDLVKSLEREISLANRLKQVRESLCILEDDIDKYEYVELCNLGELINVACIEQ